MIGFAVCGSFCNHASAIEVLKRLVDDGEQVLPIVSERVYTTSTRFGAASELIKQLEEITGKSVIHTIEEAEPIGPVIKLSALIICPCTGNTAAKLANGICDTAVTMAAKAHLRNNRPLLIAFASNDGLSGAAPNVGRLLQRKNVYFVPMSQDSPKGKPHSLVCDFSQVPEALALSLKGEQIQPLIFR